MQDTMCAFLHMDRLAQERPTQCLGQMWLITLAAGSTTALWMIFSRLRKKGVMRWERGGIVCYSPFGCPGMYYFVYFMVCLPDEGQVCIGSS